jgi:hypothetical protein
MDKADFAHELIAKAFVTDELISAYLGFGGILG